MYRTTVYVVLLALLGQTLGAAVETNDITNRGIDSKDLLTSIARGFVTTAAGSSQVVSLNLTNLLVLVLLKALIFAAGSIGTGAWKGGLGRSNDEPQELLTEEEILLFLSYLTGAPEDNGCLQSISCRQPKQAKKYTAAGDILMKTSKVLAIHPDAYYEKVLEEVNRAADAGLAGENCDRFNCDVKN